MIDNAQILAGLADIIKDVTAGAAREVTLEKSFVDDFDIDSLAMVEFAVEIEERLGVKVPDEELPHLKTVGDAVNYVSAHSG